MQNEVPLLGLFVSAALGPLAACSRSYPLMVADSCTCDLTWSDFNGLLLLCFSFSFQCHKLMKVLTINTNHKDKDAFRNSSTEHFYGCFLKSLTLIELEAVCL